MLAIFLVIPGVNECGLVGDLYPQEREICHSDIANPHLRYLRLNIDRCINPSSWYSQTPAHNMEVTRLIETCKAIHIIKVQMQQIEAIVHTTYLVNLIMKTRNSANKLVVHVTSKCGIEDS